MRGHAITLEQGRRARSRLRVSLPCRLVTRSHDRRGTLCDLSETGCKIRLDGTIPPYGEALVQWMQVECMGAIVWNRSGFFGVEFHDPIPHRWLIQTRTFNETGSHCEPRTATIDLAQQWVSGIRRV